MKEGHRAPDVKPIRKLAAEGRDLLLLCVSRKDGSLLWRRVIDSGNAHFGKQNMSSPSPVTDGKHVWVLTGTGILACFQADGTPVWRRALQKDYGKFGVMWGYASSPLLLDDKLIVQVLHGFETDKPSYLVAFDPRSGRQLWKVDRPTDQPKETPDAYTTPVPMQVEDQIQIIVSGGGYVTAHEPADGKEIWRSAGLNPTGDGNWRTVSSPLVIGDMVIASTRSNPIIGVRGGGRSNVTETHLAWSNDIAPDVPTPVSDGRHLYVLHDDGFFSCLNPKTGEPYYEKQRLPRGKYDASPLLADGRLYVTSEEAKTTVVATGPEFRILATNELEDGYTLSSIAVAGSELFIRTSSRLYCISNED
jgi:outer membrane protein assembly factor BamB